LDVADSPGNKSIAKVEARIEERTPGAQGQFARKKRGLKEQCREVKIRGAETAEEGSPKGLLV